MKRFYTDTLYTAIAAAFYPTRDSWHYVTLPRETNQGFYKFSQIEIYFIYLVLMDKNLRPCEMKRVNKDVKY